MIDPLVASKQIFEHISIRLSYIDFLFKNILVPFNIKYLKFSKEKRFKILQNQLDIGVFKSLPESEKILLKKTFNSIYAFIHSDNFDFFDRLCIDINSKESIIYAADLSSTAIIHSNKLDNNNIRYMWRWNLVQFRDEIISILDDSIKLLSNFTDLKLLELIHPDPGHPSNTITKFNDTQQIIIVPEEIYNKLVDKI